MTESNRVEQWRKFSALVEDHINTYTLEQYGNPEGNEQVDSFTIEDCWQNCQRYYNRRNSAVRGEEERRRDVLKVAHYMSFIHDKLVQEDSAPKKGNIQEAILDAVGTLIATWITDEYKQQDEQMKSVITDEIVAKLYRACEAHMGGDK